MASVSHLTPPLGFPLDFPLRLTAVEGVVEDASVLGEVCFPEPFIGGGVWRNMQGRA